MCISESVRLDERGTTTVYPLSRFSNLDRTTLGSDRLVHQSSVALEHLYFSRTAGRNVHHYDYSVVPLLFV